MAYQFGNPAFFNRCTFVEKVASSFYFYLNKKILTDFIVYQDLD
ncbi:hypothetical protein QE431_004368 [Flavobacterium sp. SORGH_AS 622]|nr:hypothetical protein [Flavobacterium sp. SORGH_AS_0622]